MFHFPRYIWGLRTFWLLIVVVFCPLFIPMGAIPSEKEHGIPKIEFDSMMKDLGTIAEGNDKEFTFFIKNTGNAQLEISRLSSLCDCVEVSIDDTIILPGESTALRGLFRSAGRWGKQEKIIIIHSNAPDNSETGLKIHLLVQGGVRVTPRSLSFGEIPQKSYVTKIVNIEAKLEIPLKINKIEIVSAENVSAKIARRQITPIEMTGEKDGFLTEIDIMLKATNDSTGEFAGKLAIQTNWFKTQDIQVLFSGEKTGDLEVDPFVVHFKDVIAGDSAQAAVTVKSLRNGPFRVIGLDAGRLPVTMAEVQHKVLRKHQVNLIFTAPNSPRRFYRGYVYLMTDHSNQKRIKIGINAVTRRTH